MCGKNSIYVLNRADVWLSLGTFKQLSRLANNELTSFTGWIEETSLHFHRGCWEWTDFLKYVMLLVLFTQGKC